MHQQTCEIILISIEAKQYTQTDVINACLHCAVHSLSVISIITLRTCRVQGFVILLVVGLLEEDISTDTGILEFLIVFDSSRSNVDIDAAYRSVLVMNAVDSLNRLEYILYRIIARVLAGFESQAFVSHILESNHLLPDFLLGEFLASNGLILEMVWTIHATIHTIV